MHTFERCVPPVETDFSVATYAIRHGGENFPNVDTFEGSQFVNRQYECGLDSKHQSILTGADFLVSRLGRQYNSQFSSSDFVFLV